jgi:hypothetical protein
VFEQSLFRVTAPGRNLRFEAGKVDGEVADSVRATLVVGGGLYL